MSAINIHVWADTESTLFHISRNDFPFISSQTSDAYQQNMLHHFTFIPFLYLVQMLDVAGGKQRLRNIYTCLTISTTIYTLYVHRRIELVPFHMAVKSSYSNTK